MRLLRSTCSDFGHWGGGVDVHLRYFQSDFGETRWVSWCWGNPQVMVIHDWMMIWGPMTCIFISLYIILYVYIYMYIYRYTVRLSIFLVGHDGQFWLKKYVYCHYEYLQVDPTRCVFEVGLLPKKRLPKGQHIITIHFPPKTMFELLFMMLMFQSSSCWWCTNRFHVFVQCGAP